MDEGGPSLPFYAPGSVWTSVLPTQHRFEGVLAAHPLCHLCGRPIAAAGVRDDAQCICCPPGFRRQAPTLAEAIIDAPLAVSNLRDEGTRSPLTPVVAAEEPQVEAMRARVAAGKGLMVGSKAAEAAAAVAICTDSKPDSCRYWAQYGECSKKWHFMHTECALGCSELPGYSKRL